MKGQSVRVRERKPIEILFMISRELPNNIAVQHTTISTAKHTFFELIPMVEFPLTIKYSNKNIQQIYKQEKQKRV
jgi:hypothetical protein